MGRKQMHLLGIGRSGVGMVAAQLTLPAFSE